MTREPLSAADARILALESGTVRGHTGKVMVIAGEHDAPELCAHLAARIDRVPRMTQRLAPGPGPPAWTGDPGFRLERHVVGRRAHDDAGLLALVGEAMATPLDRDRPLWAIDVVSGLAGRRTALVWRIHHAMADGVTAMRMAGELILDPAPEQAGHPSGRAAVPAGPAGPARGGPRQRGAAAIRRVAQLPGTLARELGPRGSRSPLDRPAGPRREVAFVSAPLDELRRIAHAAPERATVNDVVLAAVAAGLRRWLERLGAPMGRLRVKVPVSLHGPDEHDAANRDSFIVVDIPLADSDPLGRLADVARETRAAKRHHDAQTVDELFRDLTHLSRSLERFAQDWAMSPRGFTLNVSNVPGPRGPQLALGSPLLELHTLAEIAHRHALRVAVVSAAGRISFGLCADPDAVDGVGLIAEGIERELAALCRG
jgi:diacylglycerol O-acyltransferase